MEINFLSKVYSKSLLKVESLKRLIVYSLILDYWFCACVMRTSGIPQLQVIRIERLYGYNKNNKKRSHIQLDSRKQVIAFQDRVITINIKEAQHPLK